MPQARRASPSRILHRLSTDAYDAATGDLPWEAALARLASALGADVATFVLYDPGRAVGGYACAVDVPETLQRDYAAHYWKVDPLRLGAARLKLAPAVAVTDEMLVPRGELLASEGYNEGMKPYGLRYFLGGALSRAGTAGTALGLLRHVAGAPFAAEELAAMSALLPRWRRAVSLHWMVSGIEGPWSVLMATEDAAGRGVVAVERTGRIVAANRTADRLLADASKLYAEGGRLRLRERRADRELHRAIALALDPAVIAAPGYVSVPQPGPPLRLRVMPAPASRFGRGVPRCVLVMIDEQEAPQRQRLDAFVRFHRLTPAEHALVAQLAEGRTLADAARRLGRKATTARNQLQSIFEKSGTHRRAELIAKVLRGSG